MNFAALHERLLSRLREKVRSGEITERGLARRTGISQPHMHNVLKGQRKLSMQLADAILDRLDLDLADLMPGAGDAAKRRSR